MGVEICPKMKFNPSPLQFRHGREHSPWSLKDYYNAFSSSVCFHGIFVLENQCRWKTFPKFQLNLEIWGKVIWGVPFLPRRSKMERSRTTITDFYPLTIVTKLFILDLCRKLGTLLGVK